jgi:hypothetical protein
MDILNPRSLREDAARALARGRDPKKLIFAYSGINLGLSLLMVLLDLWLESEISGTGGLSNLGTRAVFSTVQQAFPILLNILILCLELGYLSGMMRIARGQYADHTDLKVGLQKFWPLMRLCILQSLIYLAVAILAAQVGSMIFAMTAWAEPMAEILTKLYSMDPSAITEEMALEFQECLEPACIIAGIVFLIAVIPVLCKIRFARFCLLEDPSGRALAAIRTSSTLMRGRFMAMLKVDLRLWLYHLGSVLVMLILNSSMLLGLLDIPLPVDTAVFVSLTNIVAAVLQFVLHLTLRNRVEAVYLTAYDRLREKPREGGPVVLGNIFDM